MSQDDELLNYIVDGLPGKDRDIVARSFYALGNGDPESAPVQMTVMFTACTRKMAQIPAEIRGANVESRKQLWDGSGIRIDRVAGAPLVWSCFLRTRGWLYAMAYALELEICAEAGREVFAPCEIQASGLNEAFSLVDLVGEFFAFACLDTPRKQRMFVSFCRGIIRGEARTPFH